MINDAFSSWTRRYRIPLSFIFGISVLLWAKPTSVSVISGLPVAFLGEVLRTWSSGHIKKSKELATDGPYAYTRNPLYLGSFLIGIGFSMMANKLWILALFICAFALVYHAVIQNEEEALARRFGKDYIIYTQNVPRFIPRWTGRPELGKFTWQLVMRHREYYAWGGTLMAFVWLLWRVN
jgi:protein-S-isoprenylcysteine O-methyltransferase Ste14